MRILMICLRYPPAKGGVEASAAALSAALARAGQDVTVLTGSDEGASGPLREHGVDVRRLGLPSGRLAGLRFVAGVAWAARQFRRHDIVHAHMATGPAAAALVVARRWRVPVVVKPSSGAGPGGGNLRDVMSRPTGAARIAILRRRVSAFVAVSEEIEKDLVETWRVPAARVTCIPNGVDLAHFEGVHGSAGAHAYLYVGRIEHVKGVDVLLDAWQAAGEPGTLTLVGDGSDRPRLEACAPASVRFVGAVDDPSPYYRKSSIFVMPSRREGLSNALLEAIASGLPVIATAVGETPRVLESAGRLVPPGDATALAAALVETRPPTVDRARFAASYGIDAVASRHFMLYQKLLEGTA